ncbi:hypothetical protein GX51_07995 [Blastomyces parvus]|uniref:Uncharacterized protein n=1 Tax=Blastomyces parvus TaxID=2060905 RepID=A0A2B7WH45_9EURO|nr:hypothetical protein GX51_07995 [Blastomyces parvus]
MKPPSSGTRELCTRAGGGADVGAVIGPGTEKCQDFRPLIGTQSRSDDGNYKPLEKESQNNTVY